MTQYVRLSTKPSEQTCRRVYTGSDYKSRFFYQKIVCFKPCGIQITSKNEKLASARIIHMVGICLSVESSLIQSRETIAIVDFMLRERTVSYFPYNRTTPIIFIIITNFSRNANNSLLLCLIALSLALYVLIPQLLQFENHSNTLI